MILILPIFGERKKGELYILKNVGLRRFKKTLKNMYIIQKQAPRGVFGKRRSENMQQIYRRTPMPKCDSNKVASELY